MHPPADVCIYLCSVRFPFFFVAVDPGRGGGCFFLVCDELRSIHCSLSLSRHSFRPSLCRLNLYAAFPRAFASVRDPSFSPSFPSPLTCSAPSSTPSQPGPVNSPPLLTHASSRSHHSPAGYRFLAFPFEPVLKSPPPRPIVAPSVHSGISFPPPSSPPLLPQPSSSQRR